MTIAEEKAMRAYTDHEGFIFHEEREAFVKGYEEALKDVKEKLLCMLNTSIDNEQFFEQLDDYIEELALKHDP